MIRFLYFLCLVLGCMGFSLQAKCVASTGPTPSFSSKAVSKGAVLPGTPVAQDKKQNDRKSEVTVTPDLSRAASASLAAKQEAIASSEMVKTEAPAPRHITTTSLSPVKKSPVSTCSTSVKSFHSDFDRGLSAAGQRLARVTAYWAGEGDYYTGRCISATGVRLHDGHCAVDPSIIPYGSVVEIAGVGKYLAVDTGSAVISRTAAREGGHNSRERNALVIDLFFEDRSQGERFAAAAAKYVSISWWTPATSTAEAKDARSLFAEENWLKIQSKQL